MFLSEVFCVLKLTKNKDALQKCDSDHCDILLDAELLLVSKILVMAIPL